MTAETSPEAAIAPAEEPLEARTTILVVEDDPSARMILNKRLQKAGYQVETAENGQEGWDKIQTLRPEVVISDWMMPIMDGPQLCTKIKADPSMRACFFILLTAKDRQEDKVTALDTGADEYLVKPCDPQELMARVRAAARIVQLQKKVEAKNAELRLAMDRINHELSVVAQIQRGLLPQKLQTVPGYEIGGYYRPSTECSGDYYDVIPLGSDRFGMLIADVSGHGTPAMVAMTLARSLFHLFAHEVENPAALLERVNSLLFRLLPTTQFITAFYAVCEVKTGQIRYSSAGHNPPLRVNSAKGTAEFLPKCEGFPLKLVSPDSQYENHRIQMAPGEALILYTDGVTEGFNAEMEMFDNDRLRDSALAAGSGTPDGVIQTIMEHLLAFTGSMPLNDDVSLMLIRRAA